MIHVVGLKSCMSVVQQRQRRVLRLTLSKEKRNVFFRVNLTGPVQPVKSRTRNQPRHLGLQVH
jgi:hypothetical protein